MKKVRIIFSLLIMVLLNVAFIYIANIPQEAFAFAEQHSVGVLYSFLFGNPESTAVLCNTPALLTMFSKMVETRPVPSNVFLDHCIDESMFVNGEKVKTPIAGDDPTGGSDPKIFPLKVEQNDSDSYEWPISLHYTNPQRLSDDQEVMLAVAQRQFVIDQHMNVIDAMIARRLLFDWSPTLASNIFEATGATVKASLSRWGATGNRKTISKDDFMEAISFMSEDDMDSDTLALIPAGFYKELLKISDFIDYNKTGRSDLLAKGIIGEILGCKIARRSTGVIYAADGITPLKVSERKVLNKPMSFDVPADALSGILIWNKNAVSKAVGKIVPYVDPKSGALLGSSVNFTQRGGGKKRSDQKGIVVIREKAV
jgi:hypothetical protein